MAQDPDTLDEQPEQGAFNTSHDLDMVPLYFSQTVEAESEAEVIRGVLESNGIPTTVSGSPPLYPSLGILIYVPRNRLEEAQRLLAEQEAAGRDAADEAEAESEGR